MIEVIIVWDDGSMFVVTLPADNGPNDAYTTYSPAEAVEHVYDQINTGQIIHGRWLSADGSSQEQFRLARFYERGIRCVMTNTD